MDMTSFSTRPCRIIVGVTGASGHPFAVKTLELLKKLEVETHLIMSQSAKVTMAYESEMKVDQMKALAHTTHIHDDIAASISSGSFMTDGMIIVPCSVKTLAEIASGVGTGLIARAADVVLKERRKLVLMLRETPLHLVHCRNMVTVTEMGAIIAPPVPAFYNKPKTIDDLVTHSVGRVLDLFDFSVNDVNRWKSS